MGDPECLAMLRQMMQLCSHFSAEFAPKAMEKAMSGAEAAHALHAHKREMVTKALENVETRCEAWETSLMGAEDNVKHAPDFLPFGPSRSCRQKKDRPMPLCIERAGEQRAVACEALGRLHNS